MKVAIYGRQFDNAFKPYLEELFNKFQKSLVQVIMFDTYYNHLKENDIKLPDIERLFVTSDDITPDIDFMVSIGGDGTFLDTINYVRNSGIPIIGLNSGRLGFLANISKEEISVAFNDILEGKFLYEDRVLMEIVEPGNLFGKFNFGLNEVSIQKKDSSMITVHAYIDDEFVNSYWTDGLIVSTPTGSTAYSLSIGGPIVVPTANNFIISPIAPHNLSVRPMVIPDDKIITLKVDGRSDTFLATIDSRTVEVNRFSEIKIKKADFCIKMLKLRYNSFYNTLRNKLMWGLDKRN